MKSIQMLDLETKLSRLKLKNPVVISSGIIGFGENYYNIINFCGAFITKTITLKPKEGNPSPRISEFRSELNKEVIGIFNSIGLENPGVENFKKNIFPNLKKHLNTIVIISITGETTNDFLKLTQSIKEIKPIAIELNLSCPNLKNKIPAQDEDAVYEITKKIRKIYDGVLITKLSPNVSDIKTIAKSAEKAGSDTVSIANSFPSMAIDINTFKPKLSTLSFGYSGPAIKPIILKLVYEAYKVLKIPIIGIGGICSGKDVIEYLLAGATCVGLGSILLNNPHAPIEVLKEIKHYFKEKKIRKVAQIIGQVKIPN